MDDDVVCKVWCFEGSVDVSSYFFNDVDHLHIVKCRVEKEAGGPPLCDLNLQLEHLLDVHGLL